MLINQLKFPELGIYENDRLGPTDSSHRSSKQYLFPVYKKGWIVRNGSAWQLRIVDLTWRERVSRRRGVLTARVWMLFGPMQVCSS